MKHTLEEKLNLIAKAITDRMVSQGVKVETLKASDLEKIAKGYLLVEQCIYYRLDTPNAVDILISKYQEVTKTALAVLKNHKFEDVVFTYRKTYTNTFEERGKNRHCNLSTKDYTDFINGVNDGSIKVLQKPSRNPQENKQVNKNKQEQTMVELLTAIGAEVSQSKTVASKKATPKTKSVKPISEYRTEDKTNTQFAFVFDKVDPTKTMDTSKPAKASKHKNGWKEVGLKDTIKPKTFVKLRLKDEKNVFARFLDVFTENNEPKIKVDDHKVERNITLSDIEKVFVWVK